MTLLIIGIVAAGIIVAVVLNKKGKLVDENQNHIPDVVEEKVEQVAQVVETKVKKVAEKAKKSVAKKPAKKAK